MFKSDLALTLSYRFSGRLFQNYIKTVTLGAHMNLSKIVKILITILVLLYGILSKKIVSLKHTVSVTVRDVPDIRYRFPAGYQIPMLHRISGTWYPAEPDIRPEI